MNFLLLQIVPHLRQKDLQSLAAPSQNPRESRSAHARNSFRHVLLRDTAKQFVLPPSCPRADWNEDLMLDDIDEACVAQVLRPIGAIDKVATDAGHAFDEEGVPFFQCRSGESLVIGPHGERRILQFEIPTWCEVVEDLLGHSFVVLEASDYRSCMDIVEGLSEGPVFLSIVDLELAVWWNTMWRVRARTSMIRSSR